ncbi:7c68ada7-fd2e-4efd-ad11-f7ca9bf456f8 [Sclerotinia trifoliorum]|uniref:7c68ada7-fd2e-4efd-ad11-f7ca9bf456f8 n=1 Tax=Sclerotinia trifoliorum TaxID=28548 RepID=A0A8H2W0B6_9HELO|nr:7c68ada7-fd2e-4efd-ad11-f7ca9bf456f8 [Sclerotinia trifoliorum]
MPHKDRDNDPEVEDEQISSEKLRHRSSKSVRDPNRKHKSRSRTINPETGESVKSSHRRRKDKIKDEKSEGMSEVTTTTMADVVPELSRTSSTPGASSYPTFNKNYSKEAVNSYVSERPSKSKTTPYTPEATDIDSEKHRSKSTENLRRAPSAKGRPPSPPDTEFTHRQKSTSSRVNKVREEGSEMSSRPSSRSSEHRKSSRKEKEDRSTISSKSRQTKTGTPPMRTASSRSSRTERYDEDDDSNITSVAGKRQPQPTSRRRPTNIDTDSSPASAQDSSPKTPTQTPQFPPSTADTKSIPSPYMHFDASSVKSSVVDYLLQNGGLVRPVPKTLLSTSSHSSPPAEIQKIFGPYFNTLDQYETVLNKSGSLAVATGYRSVARRLLDRLENVFARDLSSDGCLCVMCQDLDLDSHEGSRGLSWGEVLEWVSGRRELPEWPAFDFSALGSKSVDDLAGLGISGHHRPGSPIKIDPDVADEFREHYLRQSIKTKASVDKWLSSCPETTSAPPQEVDDETLSFAILTHLNHHDRPLFNALLTGSTTLQPVSRAPTPMRKPRSDFMIKTVQSMQRLYRLPLPPRDPEVAIYLLKNPHIHNLLATISGIAPSEWEILISGRFDGFLWSGADSEFIDDFPSRGPTPNGYRGPSPVMRNPSRNNTPFSPRSASYGSRGPTPSQQYRHPVSNDEEMEIAVLAEIEREIYVGMEALEDAFEGLHRKAEAVRKALRERGVGLTMAAESRRTSRPEIIVGTPGPYSAGLGPGYERPSWAEGGSEFMSEADWDEDEMQSELAPDDSASNISSSRHRRPKRRNERRTPALVEEDEDEG